MHAHIHGLSHCDVKLVSSLLDGQPGVRLTDFELVVGRDTTGGTRTGAMGMFLYPTTMTGRVGMRIGTPYKSSSAAAFALNAGGLGSSEAFAIVP